MRYGLFVGINQYTNDITPLKCARNDALALSKFFALNGYTVNTLIDSEATATNIRKTLRTMGKQLKKDDVFLFYFSGHGCEVNKNHYLIGQAAFPDGIEEGEETVALNRIRELTDVPGVRRLFMLDCCRNDLHGGKSLDLCPESRDIALAKISTFRYDVPEIIHPLIVTSCSTGERSYEDQERGRGYFTQILEKSLENNEVDSFASFRKFLADGMTKLQNILNRKQTLCWHGNVDAWDDFKLLDSWKRASVIPQAPVSEKRTVPDSSPLTTQERMKFNDLIFSIEGLVDSLRDLPASDSMKKSLESIEKNEKMLSEQEQNRKNFDSIQELYTAAETLKKKYHFYKSCREMSKKIEARKDFLKQHGVSLDPEISMLEKKALFAQKKDDFEVAGDILCSAEQTISKLQKELSLTLKQIAGLKAEIEKTEVQLERTSDLIKANTVHFKQLSQAENANDYPKVQSILTEILKNNKALINEQTAILESISSQKAEISELEKFFKNKKIVIPEETAAIRENARIFYEQKKYQESEKEWKSLCAVLKSIKDDFSSCQALRKKLKNYREKIESSGINLFDATKYKSEIQNADQAKKQSDLKEELTCLNKALDILKKVESDKRNKEKSNCERLKKEIDALEKEFHTKNHPWYGMIADSDMLKYYKLGYDMDYSLPGNSEVEKSLNKKELWEKRIRILALEKESLLLHWILFVPITLIVSLIMASTPEPEIAVPLLFVPGVILSALCGVRFGRLILSALIFSIITNIILYNTANNPSIFLSFVLIAVTMFMWFFIPLMVSYITFYVYKAVWRAKYKDLITMSSFRQIE